MRRREFIAVLDGAVAWPVVARAQAVKGMRRIGVLMNAEETRPLERTCVAAFTDALSNLGWMDGRNLDIELRWNDADAERARTYATDLVGLAPDAILVASTTNLLALQRATQSIPIVFVVVSDPVAQGIVTNLNRPGGNVTGFSYTEFSVGGKWVEMLKQISPELVRVAVMSNPHISPQTKFFLAAIETAAPTFDVQVIAAPVRTIADIESAIENFSRRPNGGLIVLTDGFTTLHAKLIAELASRYRLPSIFAEDHSTLEGDGLMYYGSGSASSTIDQYRHAAAYVDRILRGTKPGDLPVQLATSYKLIINLKTAKALGLTVPISLLGRADEVIE
jgi:putative tryptophan/tyrosine transport system substrate-binding protein